MTDSVTGQGAAPAAVLSWGRAAYDAYAEGLYTYCLSVLRDHASAAESLRSTFVLADRHIGRLPDLDLLKPWLYALARYECLVRLDAHVRVGAGPARPEDVRVVWAHERSLPPLAAADPTDPFGTDHFPGDRRNDLDVLAWPEAVGLTPEQRESLELSVRHGLDPRGLAAVLGCDEQHARSLLLGAGREVDRTRAAVAGAESSHGCPEGQELATTRLTPPLRERLIAHVRTCHRCGPHVRRAATHLAPTAGAAAVPVTLPTVAPPPALRVEVLGEVGKGRSARRPPEIARRAAEFDGAGFPVFAACVVDRGNRRRATLIAAFVVAAVVAAPALALWQASNGAGDETTAKVVTIASAHVETHNAARPEPMTGPRDTGLPQPTPPTAASREALPSARPGITSAAPGTRVPVTPAAETPPRTPGPSAVPAEPGALADAARPADRPSEPVPPVVTVVQNGERTIVTVHNPAAVAVDWRAGTSAAWLRLGRTGGTLAPGEEHEFAITVDAERAPKGTWSAHVVIDPGGVVIAVDGRTGEPRPHPATSTPKPSESTPPATATPPSAA